MEEVETDGNVNLEHAYSMRGICQEHGTQRRHRVRVVRDSKPYISVLESVIFSTCYGYAVPEDTQEDATFSKWEATSGSKNPVYCA